MTAEYAALEARVSELKHQVRPTGWTVWTGG
jgi:hypothetical protein